ncbi:hypothetical protein JM946_13605 [Steroidobacter sp. S1-65]|uniref:Uncharacterized protein n=1 Tax=Steroidobacter gossypii TaxID=2805490 RepID=A0ABS1WXQ8_9GAMM|nr:hypothetical protein [Steroidobacter gossypii]MBM0105772.1 hypothetical protein [Steroidobacter gossypii]
MAYKREGLAFTQQDELVRPERVSIYPKRTLRGEWGSDDHGIRPGLSGKGGGAAGLEHLNPVAPGSRPLDPPIGFLAGGGNEVAFEAIEAPGELI